MAYNPLQLSGKLKKSAVPILTHTFIDKDKYTLKPIGPFYDHNIDDSYAMEISKGYRKMVKSPEPTGIMEIDSITYLMSNGYLPLAVDRVDFIFEVQVYIIYICNNDKLLCR